MHILNIMQCTNLGGMEQASLRLMKALQQRGHTLRVLSLNPLNDLAPHLQAAGIPAEGLPYLGKGGWRSLPTMWWKLRGIRADALLMTGHNLGAMLALGKLCHRRRLLAVHFHHTGMKPAWQWRLLYRLACQRFQAITFPSDFIRHEAEALYPRLIGKAITVRNPLPLPLTPSIDQRRQARALLGLPPNVPLVGNAGWLIPRKRWDVFLRVARQVAKTVPDAGFVVAGSGPERERLEALARELGLQQRIRWLGWQRDLAPFYASLDVLLFNADWDAFPTTPLEAISYGVPVVASVLHGGLKEVVSDARFGILLEQHDLSELARHVIEMLGVPEMAQRRGENGRARLEAMCSPAPIAEFHERLWEDAAARPAA